MKPKVSIITPLHNKAPYVLATIDSVAAQSFADWEMIVVENHSTDGGPALVRQRTVEDPRITLVEAPREVRGPGAARNIGLKLAQGDWIQFLDADDALLPGHFTAQLAAACDEAASIISCDWLEGAGQVNSACEHMRPANALGSLSWAQSAVAFTPWVVHAAWVKKSALGESPWWDERFDCLIAEDFSFWFKVLQHGRAIYSEHLGVYYRIETAGRRNTASDLRRYINSVDKGVESNLSILKKRGQRLQYQHRRALFNLYLGLLRFQFTEEQSDLRRRVIARLRDLRPPFGEAVRQKDWSVPFSYIVPSRLLRSLVEHRRRKARRRGNMQSTN